MRAVARGAKCPFVTGLTFALSWTMKNNRSILTLLALATLATLGTLSQTAQAEAPTAEELTGCLGNSASGTPVVFAALTKNMTPAEVDAVWKGAGAVGKTALSTVKAKDCVGAAKFEFGFSKDKTKADALGLSFARIIFDKTLITDTGFYANVVNVLSEKYGKPKPAEIDKKLITWLTADKRLVQFALMPTMKGKQFQLTVYMR